MIADRHASTMSAPSSRSRRTSTSVCTTSDSGARHNRHGRRRVLAAHSKDSDGAVHAQNPVHRDTPRQAEALERSGSVRTVAARSVKIAAPPPYPDNSFKSLARVVRFRPKADRPVHAPCADRFVELSCTDSMKARSARLANALQSSSPANQVGTLWFTRPVGRSSAVAWRRHQAI